MLAKPFGFVFRVLLGSLIESDARTFDLLGARLRWASPSISGLRESAATALVAEQLAACVNIVDDIHSIYRWQSAIESEEDGKMATAEVVASTKKLGLAEEAFRSLKTL